MFCRISVLKVTHGYYIDNKFVFAMTTTSLHMMFCMSLQFKVLNDRSKVPMYSIVCRSNQHECLYSSLTTLYL
jgi:hypothetical protein